MDKTFADIRVGDILYWGAVGMDHIATTIVTDTHLDLDGEHLPKCCDVIFKTNEGFEFDINNCYIHIHNCIIFTHEINGNEIYIGTTKEAVSRNILKAIDSKINFWNNRKQRLINNLI